MSLSYPDTRPAPGASVPSSRRAPHPDREGSTRTTPDDTSDDASAVIAGDFRAAFRRHAAGVVVITAEADAGRAGFTATSLASVSLDPPLISFALASTASSWPTVAAAETVVVNFLHEDQHDLAGRFATSGIDRFAAPTAWSHLPGGEPALDDAPSHLVARISERLRVGDHHIVVAEVTDVHLGDDRAGLVYHGGRYARLAPS